jgi:hypothetical protein
MIRMIRAVSIIAATLVPITAWSETWVNVPEGSEHQVDTDSIVKSGAFVMAWVRSVYAIPIDYSAGLAYSEKAHVSYDCAKQSRTTLQTITFADPDSTVQMNTYSENPLPDSYRRRTAQAEKVMMNFICKVADQRR